MIRSEQCPLGLVHPFQGRLFPTGGMGFLVVVLLVNSTLIRLIVLFCSCFVAFHRVWIFLNFLPCTTGRFSFCSFGSRLLSCCRSNNAERDSGFDDRLFQSILEHSRLFGILQFPVLVEQLRTDICLQVL
jgi:hypothetical protein